MKELADLKQKLIDIYGYYVQVHAGVRFWNVRLNELVISGDIEPDSPANFGKNDPNDVDTTYQYSMTVGDAIDQTSSDGAVLKMHRNSVIVLVVASWEDHYRGRIAKELGINKNDMTSDIFYDLNKYRQAILHAGGQLRKEPKSIPLFRRGDEVALTDNHIEFIFRALIDELNRIGAYFYKKNPRFSFDKRLHAPHHPAEGYRVGPAL